MTKGKQPIVRRVLYWLICAGRRLILLTAIVIPLMIIVIFQEKSKPLPKPVQIAPPLLMDVNGTPVASGFGRPVKRVLKLEQMSPWIIQATLSIEDRRFWSHWGIDWQGLLRAVWVNGLTGEMRQGGSTITQQLARNLYLSHEKTWTRKWEEARLALRLEGHQSKTAILEAYLNQIYYGHGCYGVDAAAQYYFQKSASDLDLAESAMLAGIPKGPSIYSPTQNPTKAKKRQLLVLEAMQINGAIHAKEVQIAGSKSLSLKQPRSSETAIPVIATSNATKNISRTTGSFHAFTMQTLDQLKLNSSSVGQRTVHSTIDLRMQQLAETIINEELQSFKATQKKAPLQAALIAIDPRNGAIRAMIGGRPGYEDSFNRVTMMSRQPGSAIKPILYLTALKQRWTAATRLRSEPTIFTFDEGRQSYRPNNYGDRYPNEEIDMRRAIAESDNIYAVKTVMAVGANAVIQDAKRLGIDSPLKNVPSLALGAFPVRPMELVTAYASIANRGERVTPYVIQEVREANQIIYQHAMKRDSHGNEDTAETYVLTQLMQSVFDENGTAHRVRHFLRRPVAAKTGTTKTDAWMAGFTPELAVVVWIGYDRNQLLPVVEARKAAPIFARFMEAALKNVPPKPFEYPYQDVVSLYIDPKSGKQAVHGCKDSRLEWFVKGTEPTGVCGQGTSSSSKTNQDEAAPTQLPSSEGKWWNNIKRWWISG